MMKVRILQNGQKISFEKAENFFKDLQEIKTSIQDEALKLILERSIETITNKVGEKSS